MFEAKFPIPQYLGTQVEIKIKIEPKKIEFGYSSV